MKKIGTRLLAVLLTLSLLTAPALALSTGQLRELLQTYYVDGLPQRVLEQTTVEDMLNELGDPYTEYFDADTYSKFMASMQDSFIYGIGVTMEQSGKGALLISVLDGTGTKTAGLKVGDIITEVDGNKTAGAGLDQIKTWLSGAEGSTVQVTLLRGGTSHTYTVTRMRIVLPATTASMIDEHIGYVNCRTFGPETQGHFEDAVNEYKGAEDRWIVDLRANGGGDVDASVQAAGTFAGGGNLTYLRDNEGRYGVYDREEGSLTLAPVVVLLDGYSASASEIFASIIRDRQAGLLVGSRTFGKGVAQTLRDKATDPAYFEDDSALKVTSYRFFSPGGATNDKVGILPHLMVSDEMAADVAYLMSGSSPKGDTAGKMRVDIKWRWYVDLKTATKKEYQPAFAALLEAIPEGTRVWLGTGGPDGWRQITPAEVAAQYALADYAPRAFTDVAESPYAAQISALGTYGIMTGQGDGTFLPEQALTRGALCALLAQSLRYTEPRGESHFADVPADAYYADGVEALYAAGLVSGYSDGRFHPEEPIDHQQFISILARAATALSMDFYQAAQDGYTNREEILAHPALADFAPWSRESVWLLEGSQTNPIGQGVSLLWDVLDNITPTGTTTRGEAAAAMYYVLAHSGILPA